MHAIDERFTHVMTFFMWNTFEAISALTASIVIIGLWALIPGVVLFSLGLLLGLIYLRCQLSITREMK